MSLLPNRFLFRLAVPCRYVAEAPIEDGDDLVDLPESCRIHSFSEMDGRPTFADVRLAWNENGLALQVEVRGKDEAPVGDAAKPGSSDRVSLWLDTRDARASHRASRYCHQIHFLPTGGGADGDEAAVVPAKIHRAQQDAPLAPEGSIPIRTRRTTRGYRLEAFVPANVLTGFDPEQNPRLGLAYLVRDRELGEQTLGAGTDFPLAEDPSLWSVLELVRVEK